MIKRLIVLETENTYPYRNLALEEYLTSHATKEKCILFLWQNRHTVVIGRNQNCWKECRVEQLESRGGYLARRLSGGGAVFHDMGNLNFTFITKQADYNVDQQLEVILEAVRMSGISARKTGRNDIEAEGRKFSGSAFYSKGESCCHHGTLMVDTDIKAMEAYLTVSSEKLASKGVSSVKSRVANLREFCPQLTIDKMKENMLLAFSNVYGLIPEKIEENSLPDQKIASLTAKFESWKWNYGRATPFEQELEKRFSWGCLQFQFWINKGRIQTVNVFSDAMDQELIGRLALEIKKALKGCVYSKKEVEKAVLYSPLPEQMKYDVIELVEEGF